MMIKLTKLIPSMFQRRLLLFVGGMSILAALPLMQMARVTLVRGSSARAEAERRLVSQQWLDTVRGEIRDRKGRVLAVDRPSMNIAVDYPVISGEWADAQAARKARRLAGSRWAQLSPTERDQAIAAALPEFDQRLEDMWNLMARTAGVSREEIDQRRSELRQQVELLATTITERQRLQRERSLNRERGTFVEDDVSGTQAATPPDTPAHTVRTADVRRPIREEAEPHVVLENVPDAIGFEFQRLERSTIMPTSDGAKPQPLLPGLRVLDARRREYPLRAMDVPVDLSVFPAPLRRTGENSTAFVRVSGTAGHTLGWMREKLFREDVERRPMIRPDGSLDRGHYRPGDSVGQAGIEQAAESSLRGDRGVRTTQLDTGRESTVDAARGRDIDLTLDMMLQARLHALFDPSLGLTVVQPWHNPRRLEDQAPRHQELPRGTPLNGAIVVIDIDTGDIVAMVSHPSPSADEVKTAPVDPERDEYLLAHLNRAIDKPYPPGSIVKPLILAAAVTQGRLGPSETIACTGHFFPDKPLLYRCWIFKQFHDTHSNKLGHDLSGSEAIKVSCNIFFFELGRRLGPQGMFDWYTRFGVGPASERYNVFGLPADIEPSGLLHENRGSIPLPEKAQSADAVLMGIGQGPITWTPLHAADSFATLARGGTRLLPRLRQDQPQRRHELNLNPASVRVALEGLRRACSEPDGTSYAITFDRGDAPRVKERVFTAPGIDIWAKTGTADAPPFIADLAFNGAHEAFDGDHAWCVFLAGVNGHPKYAVSVVIDHGGSGGRVAGPVANQVVYSLIAEGYLPDLRATTPPQFEVSE
jgi:penicillin-binding protein 2